MNYEVECRSAPLAEARVVGRRVTWRPIAYESRSVPLEGGLFIEEIGRGAAGKTIRENKGIVATFNHSTTMTLGTRTGGTLALREREDGVWAECLLPETRADVAELIQRGDARNASFTFECLHETWKSGTPPVRRVTELRLHEVSILSVAGAYPEAGRVSLRALTEARSRAGGGALTVAQRRRQLEAMAASMAGGPSFLRRLDEIAEGETEPEQPRRRFWFFQRRSQ